MLVRLSFFSFLPSLSSCSFHLLLPVFLPFAFSLSLILDNNAMAVYIRLGQRDAGRPEKGDSLEQYFRSLLN